MFKSDMPRDLYADEPRYRLSLVCEPATDHPAPLLTRPEAAASFLFNHLRVDTFPQERVLALFVDTKNRYIAYQVAFVGTLNRCACEPRAILQGALLCNANGFLVTHNHPSGDPAPSTEDIVFTRRIAAAGDVLGIPLIDHIITGAKPRWVSLRQRGGW